LGADGVEADDAELVDDEHGWSLTEARQSVDHVEGVEDGVVAIREQRKWVVVVTREPSDALSVIGSDGNDLCACPLEPVNVCSQLREMPAAKRSTEPPQEHQHYRTSPSRCGEMKVGPVLIHEGEVGGGMAN